MTAMPPTATREGGIPGGRWVVVLVPLLLAALSMLGPFSIDTPFPAFKQMGADLEVTTEQMQLVVSAYLLAFAVMSPFHGPLSDALGRRPVILVGVGLYGAASIGCALSTSFGALLGFRVLQGLCAGGGVIVSRTLVRDMFEGAQAQRLMSRVMMIFGIAPAVAPIVGGLLLQVGPWPVVFWFMAGFAALLLLVVAIVLPETHPRERRIPFSVASLLGSLVTVSGNGRFHRVAWAASLSFAGQFVYIGLAPIFVVDLLGRGELDFWMVFVPMIGGVLVGAWISSHSAGRIAAARLVTAGLGFCLFAAAVNVLLAGIPATRDLPWAVIGPSLLAVGTAAAYPAQQLTLLDLFPRTRGAAISMFTFFTLALNAVSATVLAPLVTSSLLALALASSVLVLLGNLCWWSHLRSLGG